MKNVKGDLWSIPAEVKVVTTNGKYNVDGAIHRAVMGKGTALQAALMWPGLPLYVARDLKTYNNIPFVYRVPDHLVSQMNCLTLVTLPTKNHWRDKASIYLIRSSLFALEGHADNHGWVDVLLPEPGTGYGQLTWQEVEPLCEKYLDDRFTVVHRE